MSLYLNALKTAFPALGVNGILITAVTIRSRFANGRVSQSEDEGNWLLKPVFMAMFGVFSVDKEDEKTRAARVQKCVDLHRNFLESTTLFAMLSLSMAVIKPEGTTHAVLAVNVFTIARTLHNVLFLVYPYQPMRAFSFVPQLVACGVLAYELYSS